MSDSNNNFIAQTVNRVSDRNDVVVQNQSQCSGCCFHNGNQIVKFDKVGCDWPNIIIAVVAIGGVLSKWICGWWGRPCIKFKKAERYNYTMPSSLPDSDSISGDNDKVLEFYIPISNEGRGQAKNVSVSVDCILGIGGDGDSYNVKYFGMPMQMEWRNLDVAISIAAHEDAYFRFASFSLGTQSVNTPGADTEEYVACCICSRSVSGNRFLLSKTKPVTVLSRIIVRGENIRSAEIKWVSLHWNGGNSLQDVTDEKFKIRLATKDEVAKADKIYKECTEKGVQSR